MRAAGKCRIRLLVMDVDGTLTNGQIIVGQNGEIAKAFNVKDGLGISHELPKRDIIPAVITGRESMTVSRRCAELGIREVYQGVKDKMQALRLILHRYECDFSNVAYIGDDINDLDCMIEVRKNGGLVGAPCDATAAVLECADFVCVAGGGEGAVREFIEWVCRDECQA
nr:HAD hydrolase family protein [Adlercreutzia caecimuris]